LLIYSVDFDIIFIAGDLDAYNNHEGKNEGFMKEPKIIVQEKTLTILLALDEEKYCACCPELDLVTEMDTPEEAVEDMIEAIKDYANEYMTSFQLYSNSPNRAHHLPYIEAIKNCKNDWELKMLIEIKHGIIYV